MKVTKVAEGIETVTFSQAEIDAFQRQQAKQCGMTLEAYRAMLKEHMEQDWCQCEASEPGQFCDDNYSRPARRFNRHCVQKHHWHCAVCDKLVQIG